MRYKLDNAGYVCAVSFGCYLDNCTEYTGAVPVGYKHLDEWASYACIQAYYIDAGGNLTLDTERLAECNEKHVQEAIDNAPLLRKDLYGNDEVLDSQYIKQTATGKVIVLENIRTVAPRVKITGIQAYEYDKISIFTHGKNMLPDTAKTQVISGVSFTKNTNGSLSISGTATANIEYIVSQGLFALKANQNYYLNLGGLNCELRFNENGEVSQQYVGASGLINVPKNIEVSQVVIKISKGQSVTKTFYPQLEHGNGFTSFAEYKCKMLEVDFSSLLVDTLLPSETLFPSDTLYPGYSTTINYILIENGSIVVSADGVPHLLAGGVVGLFGSYSTIYANKDVTLEVQYSSSLIDVDSLEFLQGKATTTNKFRILEDGSIEAHNGYFSGNIETTGGSININNRFKVDKEGNVTLPENASISWKQVTGTENIASKSYVTGQGYQTAKQVEASIAGMADEIRMEVTSRTTLYNEEVNTLQGGMDGSIDLSFFSGDPTIETMSGKQCIYAETTFSQDVSIPAGAYKLSYEWLRSNGLFIYAKVEIYDLSGSAIEPIYSEDLGYAWAETDVWTKQEHEFTLLKTSRIRFCMTFSPSSGYTDRVNSLYLTNIALYGTAQGVADAIEDVKAELRIQEDKIALSVKKDNVISAINLSGESISISANKIDLVGLVSATEFTSKYATINSLNAVSLKVSDIEANYITADAVKATYATLDSVNAMYAKIDTLSSNNVTINNTLSAHASNIQSLFANDASINNVLASKASISELQAINASLGDLIATKASISDLNAVNAKFGNLNASNIKSGTLSADRMDIAGLINSGTFRGSAITVYAVYATVGFTYMGVPVTWGTMNGKRVLIANE